MKQKLFFTIFYIFGSVFYSWANNDKYRLILIDNPATAITVGWNQISGSNPVVYYDTTDHGTDYTQYSLSKTVDRSTNFRGMNNSFARLSGLTANTTYYFIIRDSEGSSQRFWFKTAPDDNSRLFFIAGGDSRNNRTPRQNANKLVAKLKPHAVFFGGDMTDDDTSSEWQDWFDDWQLTTAGDGRMFPVIPARGNHESSTSVYNLFDTPDTNSYYATTWGNNLIRTYTLNSEISVLGNQLTWLQNDLGNSSGVTWKMAQYHKPMRPHTSAKSEGNSQYDAWAQLFYDEEVRLVVDCDSHMSKTTWPVRPSAETGHDEGFVVDELKGTVYTGEGCWGAPLRPNNDDKNWTRNSGTFNQFKLIFVDDQKIELRTVNINNESEVTEGSNTDPFTLPANLNVFSPSTGSVVNITKGVSNPCEMMGTSCDDGNAATVNDEEDGFCNCEGLLTTELQEKTISVAGSSDDAEEETATGAVNLDSSDLELTDDGGKQLVGIRFENVQIPDGATLYRAYIQFEANDVHSEDTRLTIHGELSATSSTFTTTTNDISSRSLTRSSVDWNEVPAWETTGESGLKQRTPYLTNIVEEIVSQPGWLEGNAVTFIISGDGKRVAESMDGSTAPVLKLFYQSPCNPVGTVCDDGDINTPIDIEDGNCNCAGIKRTGSLRYRVNHGDDDAEEAETGGTMYTNSSDLELVFDSYESQNNQTTGIRFNNILLPKGALILDAHIQFTADEAGAEGTNLLIKGEKAINSIRFTDEDFNISNRTKTNASVIWNAVEEWSIVGDAGDAQKTPNLKEIVQEIIDQENWSPFNSMSFLISGSGVRTAVSFDGSESGAPELLINYTLNTNCPATGTPCDDGKAVTVLDIQDGDCNCIGIERTGSSTYEVNHSEDDAEEAETGGSMYLNSTDLELVFDSYQSQNNQTVGIRFNNIALPQGSTVLNAHLQFTVDEAGAGATNLVIKGEKVANSARFTADDFNISGRTKTSASVNWDNIREWGIIGSAGSNQKTPDLKSIVQEIVNQADWKPFNSLSFFITGTGVRTADSFDSGEATPQLIIEHSVEALSVNNDAFTENIEIYPNPVTDELLIKSRFSFDQISIYDIRGRLLSNFKEKNTKLFIDMSHFPQGIYFVEMKSGNSKETRKIIKE